MKYNKAILFSFICLGGCFTVGMDNEPLSLKRRRDPSPQSKRFKKFEEKPEKATAVEQKTPLAEQKLVTPNFLLAVWQTGTDLTKVSKATVADLVQARVLREKEKIVREREERVKREKAQDRLLDFINSRAHSLGSKQSLKLELEEFPKNYTTDAWLDLKQALAGDRLLGSAISSNDPRIIAFRQRLKDEPTRLDGWNPSDS
jgi:hypothetical protein